MGEPLKVRLYETLRNFLDMYKVRDETVLVLEAVANALDAKAKSVMITFQRLDGEYYVTFANDAKGMSRPDFENYHTVSLSTKSKGQGIGFAGVGAKIFLASDEGTEIITATAGDDGLLASRMYRQSEKVEYETSDNVGLQTILDNEINISHGTLYRVKLTEDGYLFLRKEIMEIVRFWFNYALMDKVIAIQVDGKQVEAWMPGGTTKKRMIVHKGEKIACYFTVSKEKIPEEQRHIVYTVFGKRITNEFVDFSYQIQGDNSNKVFCVADVSMLARCLISSKEDFDKNSLTNAVRTKIKHEFYDFLKSEGLIRENPDHVPGTSVVTNELTKRLDTLLKQKEFRFLNPWFNPRTRDVVVPQEEGDIVIEQIAGGQDVLRGVGTTDSHIEESGSEEAPEGSTLGENESIEGYTKNDDGNDLGKISKKRSKGLFIIVEDFQDDPREGWVDMESRGVVYNEGHQFARNFKGHASLFNYNIARVVISALIKSANDKQTMDAKAGLELLEKVLHGSW